MNKPRFIKPAIISTGIILLAAGLSYAAEKQKPATPPPPPYSRNEAVRSGMNPHNQISDEGLVLWGTCTVCHKNTPDIKHDKSVKDFQPRFDDPDEACVRCHTVKIHPGSEGIGASMSGFTAPNHLTTPSKNIKLNIRLILKDVPTIMPLEPKTGKVMCATCHNPHERGLLIGKADYGADYSLRLRSAGLDICEYCHRK